MRVEKKPKAFAYKVPIPDYNYLQCQNTILLAHIYCTLHASAVQWAGLEAARATSIEYCISITNCMLH